MYFLAWKLSIRWVAFVASFLLAFGLTAPTCSFPPAESLTSGNVLLPAPLLVYVTHRESG
jgi:hypothetical protein